MQKPITPEVKEKVYKATEVILEETKEVDVYRIKELLEKELGVKFVNIEALQKLIKEALDDIVYIYC